MKAYLKDPILFFVALSVLAVSTDLIGGVITGAILITTVFLIFIKDGLMPLQSRSVLLYLFFCFIVLAYASFGRGVLNARTLRMELFTFITTISVFIISFHLRRLNNDQVVFLLVVFLIVLSYSAIATTYVGMIDPMALREYGFGDAMDADMMGKASLYQSMGMMNYSTAHAMSVVCVGLSALFCFSSDKRIKVVSAFLLLVIIRFLFIMTITTALILTTIGVALVFASYYSKGSFAMSIAVVFLVLFVFFGLGLSSVFLDFSQDRNADITRKLSDAFSYVEFGTGGSQTAYRQELYDASLSTFFRNPVFGLGVDNGSRTIIGEHSFLFDALAYYGLFALLLFVAWWKEYKVLGPVLSKELKICYYFSFIPVVCLFTLKARSVCSTLPFFSLIFLRVVFLYLNGVVDIPKANNNLSRRKDMFS